VIPKNRNGVWCPRFERHQRSPWEKGQITHSVRILLVDDFEPWRRFVASQLQKNPEWQIISEALDGLEAVQKAEEFQPDLIMLDIGLPKLNGIEATPSIRKVAPESKILFCSENRFPHVVAAALNAGGHGYVIKSATANELLVAVEAVLRDFVVQGAAASFPSRCNSVSGRANSVKPQSMHTRIFGNTKTVALSRFSIPGKWMFISVLNFCWFAEVHDLQVIRSSPRWIVVEQSPGLAISQCAYLTHELCQARVETIHGLNLLLCQKQGTASHSRRRPTPPVKHRNEGRFSLYIDICILKRILDMLLAALDERAMQQCK
jgi:DNA-binding NarL/FixJ family response regulator